MQINLAVKAVEYTEADVSALAEHIEGRAWQDLAAAAPDWLRLATGLTVHQLGGLVMLAAPRLPHLLFNRVIGLGEYAPATPAVIDEVMQRYWELGVEQYWVHVGPYARPARLGRLLQEHGLAPWRRSWVKLARAAQRAPAASSVCSVRDARAFEATEVASIVGAGLDLPQRAAELFGVLIGCRGWKIYVAELDGEIVAAGGMFVEADLAYLAFAATRPEFRNRGAQRALLQTRINTAVDMGCRWIAADTGFPLAADEPSPSYHNLLWAGFRPAAIRDNYAPPGTQWRAG